MVNGKNGNEQLIETLKKKQAELAARLAKEQMKKRRRMERDNAREFATVGEALCRHAAQSPDFKLMLKQVLPSAVTDDRAREFLRGKGWL